MSLVSEETRARLQESGRRKREQQAAQSGGFGENLMEGLDRLARVERTIGLGVGTAASFLPPMALLNLVPGVRKWAPNFWDTPAAFRAFGKQAFQGDGIDWDAGIKAYQDELDAGTGYWGGSEVLGSALLTGVPALVGKGLISAAPRLAGTLAKGAPRAARPAVTSAAETAVRGTGKALRMPWEAEEFVGRHLIARPARAAAGAASHSRLGRAALQPLATSRLGRKWPKRLGGRQLRWHTRIGGGAGDETPDIGGGFDPDAPWDEEASLAQARAEFDAMPSRIDFSLPDPMDTTSATDLYPHGRIGFHQDDWMNVIGTRLKQETGQVERWEYRETPSGILGKEAEPHMVFLDDEGRAVIQAQVKLQSGVIRFPWQVHPDYRGKNYAHVFLNTLEELADKTGQVLEVHVEPTSWMGDKPPLNITALKKLYKKHGFVFPYKGPRVRIGRREPKGLIPEPVEDIIEYDEFGRPVPKPTPRVTDAEGNPVVGVVETMAGFGGVLTKLFGGAKSFAAIEWDEDAVQWLNKNHNTNYKDMDVSSDEAFDQVKNARDRGATHYHCSPVCKSSTSMLVKRSYANNKAQIENDKKIAGAIVRHIRELRFPTFTLENVEGYQKTVLFDDILEALDDAGYEYDYAIYNAADYGGNQTRNRLIVRATLVGELPPLPEKTGPTDWYASLEDLINVQLADPSKYKSIKQAFVPQQKAMKDEMVRTGEKLHVNESIHRVLWQMGVRSKHGRRVQDEGFRPTIVRDRPIYVPGGHGFPEPSTPALNSGKPGQPVAGPTMVASKGQIDRIIIPINHPAHPNHYKIALLPPSLKKDYEILSHEKWLQTSVVVEVTPEMMIRYFGLPDSTILPTGRKDIRELLGNSIHGNITEQIIAPVAKQGAEQHAQGIPLKGPRIVGIDEITPDTGHQIKMDMGLQLDRDKKKVFRNARTAQDNYEEFLAGKDLSDIPTEAAPTPEGRAVQQKFKMRIPRKGKNWIYNISRYLKAKTLGEETLAKQILTEWEADIGHVLRNIKLITQKGIIGYGAIGVSPTGASMGEEGLNRLGYVSLYPTDRGIVTPEGIEPLKKLTLALHRELDEDEFFALHPELKEHYKEIRRLYNWTERTDLAFDPDMATIEDYAFRGWKPTESLKLDISAQARAGNIGYQPKFNHPRKTRQIETPEGKIEYVPSYQDMLTAGYEPISWNPYEMWRIRQEMGIRHRHQWMLLEHLQAMGIAKLSTNTDPVEIAGWSTPDIGPAFTGKLVRDPKGRVRRYYKTSEDVVSGLPQESAQHVVARYIVPDDIAKRLETMFGKRPRMRPISPFGKGFKVKGKQVLPAEVDVQKIIDWMTFVPKRAKLFLSFFQQVDFLTRAQIGTWTRAVDLIAEGRPIESVKHLFTFPKSAWEIIEANFSRKARIRIQQQFNSREELVPDRQLWKMNQQGKMVKRTGITPYNIRKAGLNTSDPTLGLPTIEQSVRDLDNILQESGVGKIRGLAQQAANKAKMLEQAMRTGLFEGVYPAAILTDMRYNTAKVIARQYAHLSDDEICSMIASVLNKKYSTIPITQSIFQNSTMRYFLTRIFFSIGEGEGLLRQASGAFKGDQKRYWVKHWIATYAALIATANAIHFASTGKNLPPDRWVPLSMSVNGPLNVGYNTKFAAPTIPARGRNQTELTMDIVGQMDTVLRVLDPLQFVTDRQSVPLRALQNQIEGTDYFGAPIDEVGPGGIASRTAALANDLFAPIGVGQAAVGISRDTLPAMRELLPPAEERAGIAGQAIQALGLNIRGEATRNLRDRMARESGMTIEAPNPRSGQPVTRWDELTPRQEQKIRASRPDLSEEEMIRTEVGAQRQNEVMVTRQERQNYENDLVGKLNRIVTDNLSAPMETAEHTPIVARKDINQARTIYYNELYGTLWDEEREAFTGGLYERMGAAQEPQKGTVQHLLWRYRELFRSAIDPATGSMSFEGESGRTFNQNEAKFWASLTPQETRVVLDNVRILESKFPKSVQKLLNAGRYASNVRLEILGSTGTYWDMEKHELVKMYIAQQVGVTEHEGLDIQVFIDRYLDMSFDARNSARKEAIYRDIDKALVKAKRANTGILWYIRDQFVSQSPLEWNLAMHDAGYSYQGSEKINFAIADGVRAGKVLPEYDYKGLLEELFMERGTRAAA